MKTKHNQSMSQSNLQITLFGSPSIMVDGRPVTGFPSSKVTALAYYLAATGRPHTRDALAGLIWPDYDSASAKRNLRGALYHLRKQLGDFVSVNRQAAGFDLTQNVVVDCLRFEQAIAATSGLAQESEEQLDLLLEAAALYRGDFLDGFHIDDTDTFDDWQRAEQERYLHLIAQTLNALVQSAIQHNDMLRGVDYASRLVNLDPLREETHRHLMLLLAMDGQAGAAMAQFEQCREILSDELGLEPDDETLKLAQRIEAGDFSIGLAYPSLPRRRLHNLPAEMTAFFDRVEVAEQLLQMLADRNNRLVTINGAGGIGKSRFVRHMGHRLLQGLEAALNDDSNGDESSESFHVVQGLDLKELAADGIYFVSLAGIESTTGDNDSAGLEIVAAIAEALQLDMTENADMLDQLSRSLADHRLLLILDNFEQLQPQSRLIVHLLQHVPGLTVLVTSRTRLNVRGERVVVLDGLPLPKEDLPDDVRASPAGQLFIAAAEAVAGGLEIDETAGKAIARTCNLLQGMPLGIELAASWTAMLSCDEIAEEIQANLDFLESSMPDLPERHRSLRAIFNQSWRLLSEAERQTVQRLALFRGGFTREAAAAVADARLPALQSLVNKSLIKRTDSGTGNASRYEMPEVLRQYAAEHLVANNDYASMARDHAAYFDRFLRSLATELRSGDQHGALTRVAAEIENLRSAQSWSIGQLEQRGQGKASALSYLTACTRSLFDFYDVRGWFQEGVSRFGDAADAVERAPDREMSSQEMPLQAALRVRQAWFRFHLGEHGESERMLLDALDALQDLDASGSGTDLDAASNHAASADEEIIFVLNYLGAVLRHRGKVDDARERLGQALDLARREQDDYAASVAMNTLGQVAYVTGDLAATQDLCARALRLKRKIGDRRGMIYSLTYLGRVAQERGELEAARTYFAEAMEIADDLEDPRGVALAQQNLGNVAVADRHFTGARIQYQAALERFLRIGSLTESTVVQTRLAEIAAEQQQMAHACGQMQDALQTAIRVESMHALTTALLGCAGIFAATGRPDPAANLLDALAHVAQLDRRQKAQIVAMQEKLIGDHASPQVEPDAAKVAAKPTTRSSDKSLVEIAEATIDLLDQLQRQF